MIVPIGPIHPALKEPVRLKLQTEGERVVKAVLNMVMFTEVLKRLSKEKPGRKEFTCPKGYAVSVLMSTHRHLPKLSNRFQTFPCRQGLNS